MSTGAHNLRFIDAVDRTGLYTVKNVLYKANSLPIIFVITADVHVAEHL